MKRGHAGWAEKRGGGVWHCHFRRAYENHRLRAKVVGLDVLLQRGPKGGTLALKLGPPTLVVLRYGGKGGGRENKN